MVSTITTTRLAQTFDSVNTQLPLPLSDMMIHHKERRRTPYLLLYKGSNIDIPYGVSQSRRVISPQLLFKRFNQVRDCLQYALGVSPAGREVIIRQLTLWAYYGKVYPKQATICAEPGCSKATYWRTIRHLKERGLIEVVNRYIFRHHAQISNLYRLDNLVLLIARYLAEHGQQFREKWLKPYLQLPWTALWEQLKVGSVDNLRRTYSWPVT